MISILTIVKGRRVHLENLLRGVSLGEVVPDEVVIVHMNEAADDELPDFGLNLKRAALEMPEHRLPLAAARNKAAELAGGNTLIFLDVDCIPHPGYVAKMSALLDQEAALYMGEARYLPPGPELKTSWNFGMLEKVALPHPRRPNLALGEQLAYDNYALFWSLCFGIRKEDFARIGGFSEAYTGYGGEDTDFAFAAERAGLPFVLCGARVYHQHHATHSPPYNHLEDIVVNAIAFYRRWGRWPMEGWLGAFREAGLVYWEGETLSLLRLPDTALLASSRSEDPFA